jgi:hypothetical protein
VEEMGISENGEARVHVALNTTLKAGKPWQFTSLPFRPEAYMEEAFHESNNQCVKYQLMKQGFQEQDLDDAFDRLSQELHPGLYDEGWRSEGITAKMLLEFCKNLDISCCIVWNNTRIGSFVSSSHGPSVAMVIHGDHGFFIKDSETKKFIARYREACRILPQPLQIGRSGHVTPLGLATITPAVSSRPDWSCTL